jgi:hypothetical protein
VVVRQQSGEPLWLRIIIVVLGLIYKAGGKEE